MLRNCKGGCSSPAEHRLRTSCRFRRFPGITPFRSALLCFSGAEPQKFWLNPNILNLATKSQAFRALEGAADAHATLPSMLGTRRKVIGVNNTLTVCLRF